MTRSHSSLLFVFLLGTGLVFGLGPASSACAFAATTGSSASTAAVTPEVVMARWREASSAAVQSGRFEELRTIPGFPKPLRSTGRYTAEPGKRILWVVEKPFPSEIEVRPDAVRVTNRSGTTTQAMPSTEAASFFFALVSGDVSALAERFTLTAATHEGDLFELVARPKSDAVKAFLTELRLSGTSAPTLCTLLNPRGEKTEIRLLPEEDADHGAKESIP